ncbi:MAG: type II secretion system protein [Candidatus Electrothrix aestuarii]|uniref:Type II secretion system protein n=1 Tax=Candidatus Electrothrix aestuarii TaxID=3062594 RepID=A0AAU8LRN6_9BACT|nr:type II secretion system protein [Candidatus Electrothrix aestuarii]
MDKICLVTFLRERTGTDQQGFTLIELVVVMVLISITAAFTMPKIQSSLYSNELSATAQRFVGLVTEAGQEARAKHIAFILRFDRETKAFLAIPVSTGPETAEEEAEKAYLRAKLDDSVTLTGIETKNEDSPTDSDDTGIRFTTKGYTRKAAIHFESDTGDQVTVMLSPFLGVARILEGHVSLEQDQITLNR